LGSPSLKGYIVLEGTKRWIGKKLKKDGPREVRRGKRKGA